MSISNYLEDKALNHLLRATTYTPPATIYCSLHTTSAGETGANEVAASSRYARKVVSFGAASSGVVASSTTLSWTNMAAQTIRWVALWDATASGNCLWTGALSSARTTQNGDTFQITSGNLTVSLD